MREPVYIAIDLKSFYASVECVERHIDPLTSCLVVADSSRTDKTICLAVSPGLKSYGVPGRPRLFEVIQKVREINNERRHKTFGIKAELLIDHAWGWEPCTMGYIKSYVPENKSLSSGQVLQRPYMYDEALVIVMEMSDLLALDLVRKGFVTDQMMLTIGYECLKDPAAVQAYRGKLHYDWYGRPVPKHAHGTANLGCKTASSRVITDSLIKLYEKITDRSLLIRRVNICACCITSEHRVSVQEEYEQLDLFTDYETRDRLRKEEAERQHKETALQTAILEIKAKYGKNAILKGTNFRPGAMTIERNMQIGGHKA